MPGEIRRGKAAIKEANENSGGGGEFSPFIRSIFWKEDGEERYLLFLNMVDEMPQFDIVDFIPTDRGYPEMVVAKTDPYFGDKNDPFETEWDATPRLKQIAIAVELEPLAEVVKGRNKVRGFEVKTEEFSKKIIDDEGNVTDETEDVIAPVVGVITQSPKNFFNVLEACDNTDFPVHETPVRVKRIGAKSDTTYKIDGYDEIEVDLSNLIEYIDGVSYIGDDLDELLGEIEDKDALEAAHAIGMVLLDKRTEELLDEDRYDEIFGEVNESMDKFGKKKDKKKDKKSSRQSRPSQRRKAAEEDASEDADAEPAYTHADEPESEVEEPKKKRKAKAVTSKSDPKAKLSELRNRSASKTK